jgi:hypothetical protein
MSEAGPFLNRNIIWKKKNVIKIYEPSTKLFSQVSAVVTKNVSPLEELGKRRRLSLVAVKLDAGDAGVDGAAAVGTPLLLRLLVAE